VRQLHAYASDQAYRAPMLCQDPGMSSSPDRVEGQRQSRQCVQRLFLGSIQASRSIAYRLAKGLRRLVQVSGFWPTRVDMRRWFRGPGLQLDPVVAGRDHGFLAIDLNQG